MTRISKSDQAVLLLRAQLQRLARENKAKSAEGVQKKFEAKQSPLDRIQALGRIQDLSDEDRKRLFVKTILIEEFGEELSNDPRFIAISNDVYETLSRDESGQRLLRTALSKAL